jgi:hypothetical protein
MLDALARMKSPEMHAKAAELGGKIIKEAGVEVAVRLIEGCKS